MRHTVPLLTDAPMPVLAVLGQTDVPATGTMLQDAETAEVVAELPNQNARHVPASEIRVRKKGSHTLLEATRARVPLDALLLPRRMTRLRAPRIGFARLLLGWSGKRDCAQEHEIVHFLQILCGLFKIVYI